MAQTFSATVEQWVRESEARMLAVFKTALQFTIDEIIDRTPVDTGFLRASFQGSENGFLPLRGKGGAVGVPNYELTIAALEAGDTFYGNYTANYAAYVENGARGRTGRHMVKLSAQNWQANVNRAVSQLKSR